MEPTAERREHAGGLPLVDVIDRASMEPTVEWWEHHATADLGTPGRPAAIEPAIPRRDHNSYTPGRSSITYQLQWIPLSTEEITSAIWSCTGSACRNGALHQTAGAPPRSPR